MKGLLFTYLMTYGGALVSLYRPYVGYLIYVCFGIIKPSALWFWEVPEGNYSRIIAMGLLAGWALGGFGNWRFGQARGVVAALIGFMAWTVLAAFQAEDRDLAMLDVDVLVKIVLPVLVCITLIDSVRKLMQLAWVILLSVGYLAFEFNLSYLQGYNRIREEGFGSLDNNGVAIVLVEGVGLAIFLGLGARAWWQKALALGSALLLIHGVFLSNSRGGMLSLCVTGFISFLLLPKRPGHFALFGLILILGAGMAGEGVRERFMTTLVSEEQQDASLRERKQLLSYAIDSVGRRPILGVGPRNWTKTVRREHGVGDGEATEVHNTWLQIAAEMGIPALAMILSYYGLCAIRLLPIARRRSFALVPEAGDLARMVVSSLVGSVLASSFVTVHRVEVPYYIALVGAGLLKLLSAPGNDSVPRLCAGWSPSRISPAPRVGDPSTIEL